MLTSRAFFQTFLSTGPGVVCAAAAALAEKANYGLASSCTVLKRLVFVDFNKILFNMNHSSV